ncbi:MAG TPA: DNA polymerase III subunit [Candidatus Limnocylindria bacterium]|nr:DNA polymerase III subunit [Candidatus Limnocylindria bacterium]
MTSTAVQTSAGGTFRTRGQPAALDAIAGMLRGGMPHALLLIGPTGVGKTTLADDIAAGLLCRFDDPAVRPCGACRACRALAHGNHPDLHRLGPTGAGAVIPIGGREERGVRDLVRDLSLMPVEGGARVAIITAADRMTEDAQSAFLKTLEEPPAGTVLILTAADEERLLPTIRSRTVRIRLGSVARPAVEAVLVDGGLADAALAARLARLASGRPGDAVALARAPEAVTIRAEVGRTLLDLATATRTDRLRVAKDLLARTGALLAVLRVASGAEGVVAPRATRGRGKGRAASAAVAGTAPAGPGVGSSDASSDEGDPAAPDLAAGGPAARVPAAERRAAALALVAIWRDVARDLALVRLGQSADVRQLELLDDLETTAGRLPEAFAVRQLRRLDLAGERLEGNVSPELVIDALAIGWSR